MKKRTKRMETALKVIQTWASLDGQFEHYQPREKAMKDIESLAMKALRKKAKSK